jgi:hypothetical protein
MLRHDMCSPLQTIQMTGARRNRDRYEKHYLCFNVVELISVEQLDFASTFHLSFGYHVHKLNAGQKDPGTAKNFESQRASRDRSMVLLDNVKQNRRSARAGGGDRKAQRLLAKEAAMKMG